MCLTPSVGIVDDGAQLLPVGSARHGAVGTEDEVGSGILQHLIDGFLGFLNATCCDGSQTLKSTEDRTTETLLCLFQVEGRAVGEVQGHVDDAGGVVGKGIECLGIFERCAIVADMQDIDFTNLVCHLGDMLVPLAYLFFPYLRGERVTVTTLTGHIESVGTVLTGRAQVVLDGDREILDSLTESDGVFLSQLLQVFALS